MLDFKQIQSECHSIAKHLGYNTSKRSTILHLQSEIRELKHSKPEHDNNLSVIASNIENDIEFYRFYEDLIKGSDVEELPDPVNIILSHCEERGIDFELIFMNKLRYNKLRKKPKV